MDFQARSISEYKSASEVLYALYSVNKHGGISISRVAIQKVIYLSVVLAPVKELIIELMNFISYHRGPYNKSIQNTLDHLVATDYVKITSYQKTNDGILADYLITTKGQGTVEKLISDSDEEEEKLWWYSVIVKLILANIPFVEERKWKGFDRVVNLVYQDPSYLEHKKSRGHGMTINVESGETSELIEYAKEVILLTTSNPDFNQRNVVERVMVGIFQFLVSRNLEANG